MYSKRFKDSSNHPRWTHKKMPINLRISQVPTKWSQDESC